MATLQDEIKRHDDALEKMASELKIMDTRVEAPFIVSDKYRVWHRTFPWLNSAKKDMKTPCGWSYGRSVFERRVEMPSNLPRKPANKLMESLCPRCFPDDAEDDAICDEVS